MKKYEFTGEVQDIAGTTLHRIRALRDIPEHDVKSGDLGGWIEKGYMRCSSAPISTCWHVQDGLSKNSRSPDKGVLCPFGPLGADYRESESRKGSGKAVFAYRFVNCNEISVINQRFLRCRSRIYLPDLRCFHPVTICAYSFGSSAAARYSSITSMCDHK